jgi:outer membrane protein OmpA-like peptidoglycan-associated protein
MLHPGKRKTQLAMALLLVFGSALVGCSGNPKELTAADQAIQAARAAGKNTQCPNEFNAAEKMKNDAFATCSWCHQEEAIALANAATKKAEALCPASPQVSKVEPPPAPKPPAPAPPPPPAPAPAATVTLSASPTSVQKGQCATLAWSSTNASNVSIDQGVGRVDSNGSKQVCPDHTTAYRISATGQGDSASASTTVTVTHVVDRQTLHVNFDFNKATIRKPDDADLQKAIAFIKKYPGAQISLVGYTDSIGSDAYNLRLSEKRADAVKEYLVKHGVDAARIQTSGKGKADPVGDNKTEKGRFENRRVEVLILSE